MLLLLSGVHVHAPGVEGEGEEVLQARRGAHNSTEAFQPFLTLLKSGELTPGGGERRSIGEENNYICTTVKDLWFSVKLMKKYKDAFF